MRCCTDAVDGFVGCFIECVVICIVACVVTCVVGCAVGCDRCVGTDNMIDTQQDVNRTKGRLLLLVNGERQG